MIYILSIISFLLLIFLGVREFQNANVGIKKYFIPALFFKLTCGIGVGLLYTYYYASGDTFGFFKDAEQIAGLAKNDFVLFLKFLWRGNPDFEIWKELNFIQPRSLFFSKFTAVGYLISFGNYWVVSILFSFLSFFSAWKLVERIVEYFPTTKEASVLAFLFFPSVIFWSSGLMKESIAMAGLFAVVYVFIKYLTQYKIKSIHKNPIGVRHCEDEVRGNPQFERTNVGSPRAARDDGKVFRDALNFKDLFIIVIGFWLLWNLKYYYAGVLLISVGAMFIVRIILRRISAAKPFIIVLLFFSVLILPLLLVTQLHPNFYTSRILEVVVKNYEAYRAISEHGNMIHYYHLEATPQSFLINAPWALISGLFRPFVWEARSFFQFMAGVETLFLATLFLNAFRSIQKKLLNIDTVLWLGILTYIVLLAVFLALSTPNMGTLVRYRIGFYPFLVFLLVLLNPWITKRNRFLNK